MTASPLGRYSDIAAALVGVGLVVAALLAHLFIALGVTPGADTSWLDASAGIAVGVVLGQRQTTNGAGKIAAAAHSRIDTLTAELNQRAPVGDPPLTSPTELPQ